jgi:hypothetical protein
MADGAQQAIENATRLSEIGFPEFTAKLITDTFDGITASYIAQMAQYIAVVQAVSQTLTDYINNTADSISADEINGFLIGLRGINENAVNFLLGDSTTAASLNSDEARALDTVLALPAAAGAPFTTPNGNLNATKSDAIKAAIARRIANNKYDLLQTMVRQGMLRLYVDNGTIETRLTFSTYGRSVESSSSTNRNLTATSKTSAFGAGFGIGGLIGPGVVGGGFGTSSTSGNATLNVSTSKESQRDVSGSRVQVFGRVKLNFKTDFVPLAAPTA